MRSSEINKDQQHLRYKEFLGQEKTFLVPEQDAAFFGAHMARYEFAAQFARGKRVLDVGCGSGYGAAYLAREGSYVLGIDASEEAIEMARKSYGKGQARFFLMDATKIGFTSESFDLVTCFEVLEHVDSEVVDNILNEIVRCLRRGGFAMFSTPNIDVVMKASAEVPDFHINNLNHDGFRKILNRHFRHVELWGQRLRGNWIYRAVQALDFLGIRYRFYNALGEVGKKKAYALLGVDAARPYTPGDYLFSRYLVEFSGMLLAFCRK